MKLCLPKLYSHFRNTAEPSPDKVPKCIQVDKIDALECITFVKSRTS